MSADAPRPAYPSMPAKPSFAGIEKEILAYWDAQGTFQASVDARARTEAGGHEFVFYDGPPFANGLPHYGHLLTGYAKDVVPRYQTMRGRRVERRFGWDCHGLPAEMEAERELGVSGRTAIRAYGIDKFNDACRTSVLRYTQEWERYVHRQGRWVDFENDYKTLDLTYMESVIWAFKQLWDKGLIYEGYRVMPYSWACQTPLSNFEIRQDDATRPKQDPAITVAMRLDPREGDPGALELLVWTTTPWTIPSNLGIAVGGDIEYVAVRVGERTYVLGAERLDAYARELGEGEIVGRLRGSDLVGRSYTPPFAYFVGHPRAHRVLAADFVETTGGTGAVHMAPYGEDDQKLLEANGVTLVDPVDVEGKFTSPVDDFAGQHVFDANKPITAHLKAEGALLRHETIVHNYPHCWRTDTPIIYKPLSSWYVRVTQFRDRMVELNQEINWIPSHIRDGQFGMWLKGARDWSISRNRFWGAPIPVWQSDNPEYPRTDVYGSLDELERDFGVRLTDLHRPAVDALVRPNPDDPTGKSMMRRVPEVLDCWFESGSMPFAAVHYPFENRTWFENHMPADFIVEYTPQTRGWFYTLTVLGTALFDRPPFKNCICHGLLLGEDGRKLSKRLRNYPDPDEVFDRLGSDALRWYLLASPLLRGGELTIDKEGRGISEVVRLVMNPFWNALSFFVLYANVDGVRGRMHPAPEHVLDRYILAKTRALLERVTAAMDCYDLAGACAEITLFFDALNNWYIRRSRSRFWASGTSDDKQAAYDTLYTVLVTVCRIAAPHLPFLTEYMHRALTDAPSVHLEDWPDPEALPADPELVADMDRVRDACSTALMLREEHGLRARLPLQALTLAGAGSDALAGLTDLIRDEVNVKEVRFSEDLESHASFVLQPNGRVLGPRLGKLMRDVNQAARAGTWARQADGSVLVAGQRLEPDSFVLRLQPREGAATAALRTQDMVVTLDTTLTPELRAEGMARDVIRMVQRARKDADLDVSDRIALTLHAEDGVRAAVEAHGAFVSAQVLATSLSWGEAPSSRGHAFEGETDGHAVRGRLLVVAP